MAKTIKFPKKTLRDVPLAGQTVLVRVDYNVPLDSDGNIRDDYRIRQSLKTLQYLLDRGCTLVLISHLGRPKGRDERYSLEPVGERLAQLLGQSVRFIDRVVGDKVRMSMKRAPSGSVTLLENIRFDSRETKNSDALARQIAKDTGASYMVQDAFGAVHRAHASTAAITSYMPSVAGFLVEREYIELRTAVDAPKVPLIAVVGGAKIKDKIGILKAFIEKADRIVIGGAMANTFLAYKGYDMKASLVEPDQTAMLDEIYKLASKKSINPDEFLLLPDDVRVAKGLTDTKPRLASVDDLKDGDSAFDIGSKAIKQMERSVKISGTVIWNGTLGMTEYPGYREGSAALADLLIKSDKITSIIGGGDTADFVRSYDPKEGGSFSHVSTGGGAGLTLMAGEPMPGIDSLLDAKA